MIDTPQDRDPDPENEASAEALDELLAEDLEPDDRDHLPPHGDPMDDEE